MAASRFETIIESEEKQLGLYRIEGKYRKMVKVMLAPGERIILGSRQSYWASLAPGVVFATNKRVLIIKLSMWSLYTGINVMNPSRFVNIHYSKITETELLNGRWLCSIIIRILASGETRFDGLRRKEATRMIGFLERIAMANEESE